MINVAQSVLHVILYSAAMEKLAKTKANCKNRSKAKTPPTGLWKNVPRKGCAGSNAPKRALRGEMTSFVFWNFHIMRLHGFLSICLGIQGVGTVAKRKMFRCAINSADCSPP